MDTAEIEVFLVLSEELHFNRTAERLRVPQPRVSRLVAALEHRVGGALFERTSRRVRLTPLGLRLRDQLQPVYAALTAALADARAAARETTGPRRHHARPDHGPAAAAARADLVHRARERPHPGARRDRPVAGAASGLAAAREASRTRRARLNGRTRLVRAPALDPQGNYYAPAADARISMVDARDVAAVAARTLTEDGHAGKAYDVTGPEALSHDDAARKLGGRLGRPVRYVAVDDATARSAMLGAASANGSPTP